MPVTYDAVNINGGSPGIFPLLPTNPSQLGNPVMGDGVQASRLVTVQAVASANTDVSVALPFGARILAVTVLPNVAGTGTTPAIQVGSTQGGADIVASTTVAAAQVIMAIALNAARPLVVANFASIVASQQNGSIIWVRYTQGAPTAVGTYTLFVEYVMQ